MMIGSRWLISGIMTGLGLGIILGSLYPQLNVEILQEENERRIGFE